VGNLWQFATHDWPTPIPSYERREIIGDTLVGQRRYFRYLYEVVGPLVDPPVLRTGYLRYDTAGIVVGLTDIAADTIAIETDYRDDLRVNFGDTVMTAGAPWGEFYLVEGGYDAEVNIGGETYAVAARKSLGKSYAADIGPVSWTIWDGPSTVLAWNAPRTLIQVEC
jgi:hypothetical protein